MPATATVFKKPYFLFNAVDLSAQTSEINFGLALEELEKTASGDNTRLKIPGLENPTLTVTAYMSRGVGSLEATLWAAKGTIVTMKVRSSTDAVAAGNAEFTFTGFVKDIPLVIGKVGDVETAPISISFSSDIVRAIA